MLGRSLVLLAMLGLTGSLALPSARAEEGVFRPEPTAADKETARGLVALGDEKMAAKDFVAALRAYQGADAIMGVPTTGIEVARAHLALGQLVEARDVLLRVSRFPDKAGEPEAFAKARAEATKLAQKLPERIPSLTVEIRGVEPGTEVELRIDGTTVPAATIGLPRKTNPGRRIITATASGYQAVHTTVQLAEGEQRVLRLNLGAESSSAEAGQTSGTVPETSDEGATSTGELAWPVAYLGLAAAGVGVVVGAVTGGISLSIAGDVKEQCSDDACPTSTESDADRSLVLAHVSTASFVVAGVGAVLGAIGLGLALASEEDGTSADESAPTATLEPVVGVGFVGLRGSF